MQKTTKNKSLIELLDERNMKLSQNIPVDDLNKAIMKKALPVKRIAKKEKGVDLERRE